MAPDGTMFASGNVKGLVTIWNTSAEPLLQFQVGSAVIDTSFSTDGTLLAVSTVKAPISIWKLETGEKAASIPETEGAGQLQFGPAGKRLLCMKGSKVLVWDTATILEDPGEPTKVRVEAEEADALAISPDGSLLAIGGKKDSEVWIYNLETGKPTQTLDVK